MLRHYRALHDGAHHVEKPQTNPGNHFNFELVIFYYIALAMVGLLYSLFSLLFLLPIAENVPLFSSYKTNDQIHWIMHNKLLLLITVK